MWNIKAKESAAAAEKIVEFQTIRRRTRSKMIERFSIIILLFGVIVGLTQSKGM